MKKISLDSYEKMAIDYANHVDNKPWNADYERPAAMKLVKKVEGETILDAGCAAGWYTKKFIDMGAKKVVGLDFSPEMIKFCNIRLKDEENEKYEFHCHDLNEKLDFLGDKEFDKILSSLTLHYLEDWKTPLKEFHRILNNNGELIISIHHPLMEYIDFKKESYFKKELTIDNWEMNGKNVEVKFYTRPLHEIMNSITDAGFLIEAIVEPMPTEKFKEKDEKSYKMLMKKPNFLLIKAIKKN